MSKPLQPQAGNTFLKLSPYVPGLSIKEIREKYNPARIIKLASNENPLGVSPLVQEALRKSVDRAFRYPQGHNPGLVRAISKKHNVAIENIAIGNGSDEIIDMLIRIFASETGSEIICFQPCFSIYPIQAQINGATLTRVPLKPDFSFDFTTLMKKAGSNTRIVFITTPDNPSGYAPDVTEIKKLAEELSQKAPQALLVIDEAYADFAEDEKSISLLANEIYPTNVVFVRTFSKSYGLAGLRLGYAVMPKRLTDFFWRARLPFSVNVLAEEAGLAALEDETFRTATLKTVKDGRACLESQLKNLGCTVWPSAANFLMFQLPPNSLSAQEAHERLLRKGIIIRSLTSYNMPEFLRVSIGTASENEYFLAELTDILSSRSKKD